MSTSVEYSFTFATKYIISRECTHSSHLRYCLEHRHYRHGHHECHISHDRHGRHGRQGRHGSHGCLGQHGIHGGLCRHSIHFIHFTITIHCMYSIKTYDNKLLTLPLRHGDMPTLIYYTLKLYYIVQICNHFRFLSEKNYSIHILLLNTFRKIF